MAAGGLAGQLGRTRTSGESTLHRAGRDAVSRHPERAERAAEMQSSDRVVTAREVGSSTSVDETCNGRTCWHAFVVVGVGSGRRVGAVRDRRDEALVLGEPPDGSVPLAGVWALPRVAGRAFGRARRGLSAGTRCATVGHRRSPLPEAGRCSSQEHVRGGFLRLDAEVVEQLSGRSHSRLEAGVVVALKVTGDRQAVRSLGVRGRRPGAFRAAECLVEATADQLQFAEAEGRIDEGSSDAFDLAVQFVDRVEVEEGITPPQLDGSFQACEFLERIADPSRPFTAGEVPVHACDVGVDNRWWRKFDRVAVDAQPRDVGGASGPGGSSSRRNRLRVTRRFWAPAAGSRSGQSRSEILWRRRGPRSTSRASRVRTATTSQFGSGQLSIAEPQSHRAEHVDTERCLIGVGYLADERRRAVATGCVAVDGQPVDLASRRRGQPRRDRTEEGGAVGVAGDDGSDGKFDRPGDR